MRQRSDEELATLARQAAERDIARLLESELPITKELITAMARRAAETQAAADLTAPEQLPWFSTWFRRLRRKRTHPTTAETTEEVIEEPANDFEPFICRKCGKLVTNPFERCEGQERQK